MGGGVDLYRMFGFTTEEDTVFYGCVVIKEDIAFFGVIVTSTLCFLFPRLGVLWLFLLNISDKVV
jgi:hypothetical protein